MNADHAGSLALTILLIGLTACGEGRPDLDDAVVQALRTTSIPAKHVTSETRYNALCSYCHGRRGLGTDFGPPLVHPVYAPEAYTDAAFHRAVRQGMRAHHFRFGDMPPIDGLTAEELQDMIAYVRWLQYTAGIV